MNILIIGSNAREHAIARALSRSRRARLYCCGATPNLGIAALVFHYELIPLNLSERIVAKANAWRIDIAIIGPEAPLALGLADLLWRQGIGCIGPTKEVAQIESSKFFARNLLYHVQQEAVPRYKMFQNLTGVKTFLEELGADNFVIKPDGFTSGKGVKVAGIDLSSIRDAYDYCAHLYQMKQFFLIEQRCRGQEFSLHCFSDGRQSISMPVVKDFKRAYPGDQGPNTGSMGSVSDANHRLPFLTEEHIQQATLINQSLLDAVHYKYKKPYKGILYGSFMAGDEGIKLIEFNARFGDPEAINLLALLQGDFVSICEDIIDGVLGRSPVSFASLATVCKYAVPEGYPNKPRLDEAFGYQQVINKEQLYFASVQCIKEQCFTTSSRTAAVLGIAPTISEAEQMAEVQINKLNGPLFHRYDIGLKGSYG